MPDLFVLIRNNHLEPEDIDAASVQLLNTQDIHGRTILHLLAGDGIVEINSHARRGNRARYTTTVDYILKHKGVDLNIKDNEGYTPLIWAIMSAMMTDKNEIDNIVSFLEYGNMSDETKREGLMLCENRDTLHKMLSNHSYYSSSSIDKIINSKSKTLNKIIRLIKRLKNTEISRKLSILKKVVRRSIDKKRKKKSPPPRKLVTDVDYSSEEEEQKVKSKRSGKKVSFGRADEVLVKKAFRQRYRSSRLKADRNTKLGGEHLKVPSKLLGKENDDDDIEFIFKRDDNDNDNKSYQRTENVDDDDEVDEDWIKEYNKKWNPKK